MSDRTPADVIAEYIGSEVGYGPTDGIVEQAHEILAALAAAGYRVVPIPDDNAREDASALVWACSTALLFGPSSRKRMADLLAAAYLTGQPQDRPATCPTCGCDCEQFGRCPDAWHVGGSGDTR